MVIVYWLSTNSTKENDILIYYRIYTIFMENVGYKNSYGHEVVSIQRYDSNLKKFVTIQSFFDIDKPNLNISFKDKAINKAISFLEKLKK